MWFDYKNRCPAADGFELVGGCLSDQMALAQNKRESLGPQRRGTDPAGFPFDDILTMANPPLIDDAYAVQTGGQSTAPGTLSKYRGSRPQAGAWEPNNGTL